MNSINVGVWISEVGIQISEGSLYCHNLKVTVTWTYVGDLHVEMGREAQDPLNVHLEV